MASRKSVWSLFMIFSFSFVQVVHLMTVKEIANDLRLYVTIDENYPNDEQKFKGHIDLINIDSTHEIAKGNWAIFFTSSRMLGPDDLFDPGPLPKPEGVLLGSSGFQLYHITGRLFKMELTDESQPLVAGELRPIPFIGKLWIVARTDVTPNYYVASLTDDTDVAVIPNTADLSRSFVAPMTSELQYKRTSYDTFEPFTLEDRNQRYSVTDLGHDASRVTPLPRSVTLQDTTATIDRNSWVIYLSSSGLTFEGQYLSEQTSLTIVDINSSSYYVELGVDTDNIIDTCQDSEEAYHLDIQATKIQISGASSTGVFYGIQTFLQLLKSDGTIRTGTIDDCPLFPYRGIMLDVSRNFFDKEEVFHIIDAVSTYKVNKLHLHLTDDDGWRIEIPTIPELTSIAAYRCHDLSGDRCILPTHGSPPTPDGIGSGYYSVQQYKDILQYAADRHMQVIPEIDLPGHSHATVQAMLARYRKYNITDPAKAREFLVSEFEDDTEYLTVQLFKDAAVNPCIESTYAFVEEVLDTLINLHQGIQNLSTFHFGGDEVPGAWQKSPACDALKQSDPTVPSNATTRDLIAYFARRLGNLTAARGLDLAAWEDGLQNGDREFVSQPFPRADFPNNNVYSYLWYNIWEQFVGGGAYRFANNDYKSVISHATHFYYDFPAEPDPDERGGYWGSRLTDTKKSFLYSADDIYLNIKADVWGRPLSRDDVCSDDDHQGVCPALLPDKINNVIGIQCQLWGETIATPEQLENMIFPRILAMAERSWTRPGWFDDTDPGLREQHKQDDWIGFANAVGYRELGRLDHMGIRYNVRPPATRINTAQTTMSPIGEFPGMTVVMTTDAGLTWTSVYDSMPYPTTDAILVTRSRDGTRSSRPTRLTTPPVTDSSNTFTNLPLFVVLYTLLFWLL